MALFLNPSQARVHARLELYLQGLPDSSPLVGPFDPNFKLCRMPKVSTGDGRSLTWTKVIRAVAGSVTNEVGVGCNGCWFVNASGSEDFKIIKLSSSGSGNKWTVQKLMYFLANPSHLNMASHDKDPFATVDHTLSHRCSASFPKIYACCNPAHLFGETQATNDDRKGCRYGNAFHCPHIPQCIFTDRETGRYKICLNDSGRPRNCYTEHDGSCMAVGVMTSGDLIDYRPSSSSVADSQSTYAGGNQAELFTEIDDVVAEALGHGEIGLGRRR